MASLDIVEQLAVELEMPAVVLAHAPILCGVHGTVTGLLATFANTLSLMCASVFQYVVIEFRCKQDLLAHFALACLLLPEACPAFVAVSRERATSRGAPSTTGACDRASFATLYGRITSASLLGES